MKKMRTRKKEKEDMEKEKKGAEKHQQHKGGRRSRERGGLTSWTHFRRASARHRSKARSDDTSGSARGLAENTLGPGLGGKCLEKRIMPQRLRETFSYYGGKPW
ncbi:hypothetical protein E2C01_098842 [Portunus trituberculatus]|uniref:Uncharacterized protein n=1 Tax=Portunus trituberculatus TaxID=210409 RepID=A0A5B7K9F4_PORTR|nr:hypothetical protein [Portunus trituberculatus]